MERDDETRALLKDLRDFLQRAEQRAAGQQFMQTVEVARFRLLMACMAGLVILLIAELSFMVAVTSKLDRLQNHNRPPHAEASVKPPGPNPDITE